jgi:hypothetical protein
VWPDLDATAALFRPRRVVEPAMSDIARRTRREQWADACARARQWLPELSALDF